MDPGARDRRRTGAAGTDAQEAAVGQPHATEIEAIILELTLEYPAYGQTRIANEMRKLGHSVSPSGVRGVWQRHDLETMEAKVAQDVIVLTESQLAALEKTKLERRRMVSACFR